MTEETGQKSPEKFLKEMLASDPEESEDDFLKEADLETKIAMKLFNFVDRPRWKEHRNKFLASLTAWALWKCGRTGFDGLTYSERNNLKKKLSSKTERK